ncbi:MAG: hypothetical protein GWN52_24645 [Gemmatimonadetes bacterium]|nr:hypothetical protein [Gemmatimonadota bacterium]
MTRLSESGRRAGVRSTPSITLNVTVTLPIPTARVSTTTIVAAGEWRTERAALT